MDTSPIEGRCVHTQIHRPANAPAITILLLWRVRKIALIEVCKNYYISKRILKKLIFGNESRTLRTLTSNVIRQCSN